MFGGLILGVVIYFLGAFAYLLREFGENLASKEREKSTRLRAVRDVAAGIAHELRNPLNAIGLSVQVIERKIPKTGALDPSMERQFERVHMEIGRIKKVVDAFVRFARLGDLTVADFDLSDAVRETARTFEAIFAERGVEATLDVQDGVRVVGDREKLSEALAAVVQSAVEALSSGGGALRLSLVAQRREAKIVVRDTGPSLDDERLRNVFEPYRTGRDHGGFGLTLAKTIVESHGGAVDAASPEGGGCEVTLTLPRRPRRFD
jgi:two-component system, NtrC family, sensor histidine kinase HydH